MSDLPNASAGIQHECPRCEAQAGEPCRNKYGAERFTTHLERKDTDGAHS